MFIKVHLIFRFKIKITKNQFHNIELLRLYYNKSLLYGMP